MKEETPMKQILNLIPDASQIKEFISNNDADEKMLDEWLWEKIFKGNDWLEKEKQAIIDAYTTSQKEMIDILHEYFPIHKTFNEISKVLSGDEKNEDAETYFNNKYNTK